MQNSQIPRFLSAGVIAAGCVGFLLTGFLSGCAGSTSNTATDPKEAPLKMNIVQVDQLAQLGDKVPDGQFLVAKTMIQNLSNQSMVLNPTDFVLENITKDEKQRYSQPAEKMLTVPFTKSYGDARKDKLMDLMPANLYPRLELERYFVFMVPADAKLNQYQLTYKPAKVSAPMVTDATVVNDQRNVEPQ